MSEKTATELEREINLLNNQISQLLAENRNLETERDKARQHSNAGIEDLRRERAEFEKEARIVRAFAVALRDVQNALTDNRL